MAINLKNTWLHLRKIQTHRKWVRHYCFAMKLYKQGLCHDLSKYSPTEFLESVKYYQGTSSPIDAAKKDMGYSMAWFHHRGRNFHHYEMWQDDFDHGGKPLLMPYKYFTEMICDYLAAGRAYQGKNFSFITEHKWWLNKKNGGLAMPKNQIKMIDMIFEELAYRESKSNTETAEHWFCNTIGGKTFIKTAYDYYKDKKCLE